MATPLADIQEEIPRYSGHGPVWLHKLVAVVAILFGVGMFGWFAYELFVGPDLEPRPADEFESVAALAKALDRGGIHCPLIESKDLRGLEAGSCGEDGDHSNLFLLWVYSDHDGYLANVKAARSGEEGVWVFGPNWSVGPLIGPQAEDVLDIVGGRSFGYNAETRD